VEHLKLQTPRRNFLTGAFAAAAFMPFSNPAFAQGLNLGSILGPGSILINASDSALDRLSEPGAYYDDEAIRIGLPLLDGGGGLFGSILNAGEKLGILGGLTRAINDAAGAAAGEAKPIFRNAINSISFNDVPGIVSKNDGGTQYLRSSANDDLHAKLSPLIDTALGDLGAYRQLDDLSAKHSFIRGAGLDRDGMNKTVTDQGLDGIFTYIGSEEQKLRANPVGKVGKLLGDIFP
jgi:hypothetical protein